jgi:sodium/potassium-transporting ATPase subunit alpha
MIPAISLGKEESEGDVMKRPPRDGKRPLLTKSMLVRSYGFIGLIQAGLGFLFFFLTLFDSGWTWGAEPTAAAYAMAIGAYFATIIFCQIFNQIACRTLRKSAFRAPIHGNHLIFVGLIVELVLLAIILYFPPAERFFGVLPFDLGYLPWMLLGACSILVLEEIRKHYYRRTGKLGAF